MTWHILILILHFRVSIQDAIMKMESSFVPRQKTTESVGSKGRKQSSYDSPLARRESTHTSSHPSHGPHVPPPHQGNKLESIAEVGADKILSSPVAAVAGSKPSPHAASPRKKKFMVSESPRDPHVDAW